jgi:RNA polymerase-interacting CarD/CdnL/TRCF family regulator
MCYTIITDNFGGVFLFNIGDKIVYPVQGVGIIDVIEEKEFGGMMQKYYKIHLINNSMKLMLPSARVESSNIRLISDSKTLDEILSDTERYLTSSDDLNSINSKERIEMNTNKIRSGSLEDLIEVIYNLSQVKKQHSLNTSESQILKNATKFLVDEVSLIKNIPTDEANFFIENSFNLA